MLESYERPKSVVNGAGAAGVCFLPSVWFPRPGSTECVNLYGETVVLSTKVGFDHPVQQNWLAVTKPG